ncbi:Na(+)/H(+) antiporter [hydrothermal vent metagenome]|uniref:Na(+)/H(+) antiporter n=1 Tax=hydrothermal vent metagenome TaxID=652676 RepID=A0A3B0UAK3_9ZZZZ
MNTIFIFGILIITALILGKIASYIGLPKITGYLFAGILLDPNISGLITPNFPNLTNDISNFCLAFITFEVGSTLYLPKLKAQGKALGLMTILEALLAFTFVFGGMYLASAFLLPTNLLAFAFPFSLLIATLASPTDPSATLAIAHQYKAKGPVSSTIMGVAAFDDAVGLLLFSIGLGLSKSSTGADGSVISGVVDSLLEIGGALVVGVTIGILFNFICKFLKSTSRGMLNAILLGLIAFSYGASSWLKFDSLITTMTLGFMVTNFNLKSNEISETLETYTEEIIFILFFVLSGLHLNLAGFTDAIPFIIVFVIFRSLGKYTGVMSGAILTNQPDSIKKYVVGGLIPQGGIVVGLALFIQQIEAFNAFGGLILNIIMGTTILHEILGPVIAKISLRKAGEIR